MDDIRPPIPEVPTRFNHLLRRDLRGHSDVRTTEIYTHMLGPGAMGVISPMDG
jgi:hypothetical protein